MNILLSMLALAIERLAILGAGFMSFGIGFQPEVPEELLK